MKLLVRMFRSLLIAIAYDPDEIVAALKERRYDNLTGLYARAWIEDLAQRIMVQAERYGHSFSLAIIDLNHFKEVNDTQGHAAGDRLLVEFGSRITALLRSSDSIGRIGGDEFLVVFPETEKAGAELKLSSVREKMSKIPFAFGVASLARRDSFESIRARADEAMYEDKRNGH